MPVKQETLVKIELSSRLFGMALRYFRGPGGTDRGLRK